MAVTSHGAYRAAAATTLSTGLNSLANGSASAASSTIDNTSNLDLYHDVTLILAAQGSARSAGATVSLYMVHALDGTNFDDVNATTAELVAVFPLDAATTARRVTRRDIPIPPGLFQYFVVNNTGQAFAASGTSVTFRAHTIQTV